MLASSPRPTIRVDDLDVAPDERTFISRLEASVPNYSFEITLREEEWIPHAVEHIRVFLEHHGAAGGVVVAGYMLKALLDIFKEWAIDRLKRAPQNTERLTIYGPDRKPVKTITVTSNSIEE